MALGRAQQMCFLQKCISNSSNLTRFFNRLGCLPKSSLCWECHVNKLRPPPFQEKSTTVGDASRVEPDMTAQLAGSKARCATAKSPPLSCASCAMVMRFAPVVAPTSKAAVLRPLPRCNGRRRAVGPSFRGWALELRAL